MARSESDLVILWALLHAAGAELRRDGDGFARIQPISAFRQRSGYEPDAGPHTRGSATGAHLAHNQEAVGSTPTPATTFPKTKSKAARLGPVAGTLELAGAVSEGPEDKDPTAYKPLMRTPQSGAGIFSGKKATGGTPVPHRGKAEGGMKEAEREAE
jgi:hypothetical protein